mgnify:CR=1 FL=1
MKKVLFQQRKVLLLLDKNLVPMGVGYSLINSDSESLVIASQGNR